jgi:hypothetical protein
VNGEPIPTRALLPGLITYPVIGYRTCSFPAPSSRVYRGKRLPDGVTRIEIASPVFASDPNPFPRIRFFSWLPG